MIFLLDDCFLCLAGISTLLDRLTGPIICFFGDFVASVATFFFFDDFVASAATSVSLPFLSLNLLPTPVLPLLFP
jgi:hypothetical protein